MNEPRWLGTRSADDLTRDPQDEPEKLPPYLDKPVKTNDPKALKAKATDDKAKEIREQNDIRAILSTEAGVRFMGRILGEFCYIDESVFNPNNAIMSNIAGRRQVGQQIKFAIRDTDFDLWIKVDHQLEERRAKPKK